MIFNECFTCGKYKLLIALLITTLILCDHTEKSIEPDRDCYLFDASSMTYEVIVNDTYIDTIHVSDLCSSSDSLGLLLLNTSSDMDLNDSCFTWTPQISDTGLTTIQCGIMLNEKIVDTISWNISVTGYWPENCAVYTHKEDVTVYDASSLPDGYFIYNPYTETGVYRSEIHQFDPFLIPNTIADRPENLSISDDGKWICYVDKSRSRICVLTINGCNKTIVPVCNNEPGFPTIAGFYRNSPHGTEIFYLASTRQLRSVSVEFSSNSPIFSNDRVLVDLKDEYRFNKDHFMQISVVNDQVFSEISPIVDGKIVSRTGYLTIPDGGRGVGGPQEVYQWKNDNFQIVEGCGHTQSHDGKLCLANPGGAVGSALCVPHDHKGFYITAFRRFSDPPVDLNSEHIDKFGISINWCPLQYQNRSVSEVDFWGWYFGNRNDLVIGRQMGMLNENGVWMIDWENNSWYRLTPIERNIQTLQPAVYFYSNSVSPINPEQCEEDTSEKPLPYDPNSDIFNPHYLVKYPNGGEVFVVGEQCTVLVSSTRGGNAVLNISYNNGLNWNQLPGLNRSINPLYDNVIVFTIPDSAPNGKGGKISTVSSTCWLELMDYGNPNFNDVSDGSFSIVNGE